MKQPRTNHARTTDFRFPVLANHLGLNCLQPKRKLLTNPEKETDWSRNEQTHKQIQKYWTSLHKFQLRGCQLLFRSQNSYPHKMPPWFCLLDTGNNNKQHHDIYRKRNENTRTTEHTITERKQQDNCKNGERKTNTTQQTTEHGGGDSLLPP